MNKKRVPLHLITLWHPEKWLGGISISELGAMPCIKRSRLELEKRKQDVAQVRSLDAFWERFHDRPILNLGKPVYQLRKTWIQVDKLVLCIKDFDPSMGFYQHPARVSALVGSSELIFEKKKLILAVQQLLVARFLEGAT